MRSLLLILVLAGLVSCSTRGQEGDSLTVSYQVDHGKPTAPLDMDVSFDAPPKVGNPATLSTSVTPQVDGDDLEVEVVLPADMAPVQSKGKHKLDSHQGKFQKLSHGVTVPDKKYREIYVVATIHVGTAKLTKVTTVMLNPESKPAGASAGQSKKNAQGEDILEFSQPTQKK